MTVFGRLRTLFAVVAFLPLEVSAIAEPPSALPVIETSGESGLYTEAQSSHGATAYAAYCAACHGASLTGGSAPPLTGPFWSGWKGRTLGELYQLMQGSMPQDAPSSLSHKEYAAILAHMLKSGGYRAGQVELPASPEKLSSVTIGPPR